MSDSRRYLGLELAGAKNQKTALAALEYYPKERKVFLLDVYERIAGRQPDSGPAVTNDEALLELIRELCGDHAGAGDSPRMGVNVPLDLPPCIPCERKSCPLPARCTVPAVRWMRATTRKAARADHDIRVLDFTPYTQRPFELWARYHVLARLPETHRFEIDEALGGNRAPLTARMHFIKRHLEHLVLFEVWPKLSVAVLAAELGLNKRIVTTYRQLEEGVHAREVLLETLATRHGIFIYERDVTKLARSLASFDAFVCAYTALLSDLGRCAKAPPGYPTTAGWVQYPQPC